MVAIRLKMTGTKNHKKWRIVVLDSRSSRDSRFIEELGYYDPGTNPATLKIKKERYEAWIKKGARPSQTVANALKKEK